eukprot:2404296-Pyramimonas_sp.AAC.1
MILGAAIATERASFSIARMRIRFIRTSSQPWGVADISEFSVNDHAALQRGNKLPRATLRIIRALDLYQIL